MSYSEVYWIFIGMVVFVGLVLMIMILRSFGHNQKINNAFYFVAKVVFILVLYYFIKMNSGFSYSRNSDDHYCKSNHLPALDKNLIIEEIRMSKVRYYTNSDDSVCHQSKVISYDLDGIDKVTDEYINRKLHVRLQSVFVQSTIFRSEKRNYYLSDFNLMHMNKELTLCQYHSILKSWGIRKP